MKMIMVTKTRKNLSVTILFLLVEFPADIGLVTRSTIFSFQLCLCFFFTVIQFATMKSLFR
jgi:hypothetical protein